MSTVNITPRFGIEHGFEPGPFKNVVREFAYALVVAGAIALIASLLNTFQSGEKTENTVEIKTASFAEFLARNSPRLLPLHQFLSETATYSRRAMFRDAARETACRLGVNTKLAELSELLAEEYREIRLPPGPNKWDFPIAWLYRTIWIN